MLSKNTTKAISSESQRAAFARWLPSASTSPPPMMGSQINRLRRGKFDTCSCSVASAPIADERGQEHDQAEDHHEGVVVEESGLGAPQHAREQVDEARAAVDRSEEHTSELQSLMRISYAVFCLKKKITK